MVGDIMGAPGRLAFARAAQEMRRTDKAQFVVANAENAAAGKGLTSKIAAELFEAGADVLTLGDHSWDQREFAAAIGKDPRILRPANFPPGCPGHGIVTVEVKGVRISVLNLIGRVFMRYTDDCPFRTADDLLKKEPDLGRIVLVDMHAEATSEKNAIGRYLDGRVSAVAGTHTHVQTSDEKILPGGTAYITDLGLTGPADSIIGCDVKTILSVFLTGMKQRFEVATTVESAALEGALIDVDESTGRARGIKRVRV